MKKNRLAELNEKLQASGLTISKSKASKRPRYRGAFRVGAVGVTGESYWTIGVQKGTSVVIVKDPTDGTHPVFKNPRYAERAVAQLESLREKEPKNFPGVDRFVIAKLDVGKPSQIIRPSVSIQTPSTAEVSKYGK